MTLLHTNYASGNLFTAGDTGGVTGASGINQITGRVNFGGFDFPQVANIAFTSGTANEILTATYTGENHSYIQTMIYNAEISPISVKISGTTIGSVVEYVFWYANNGSLATSYGGLEAGSIFIT
jgi:hypothetical protein